MKMTNRLIALIFLMFFFEMNEIICQKKNELVQNRPSIKLRRFGIFQMKKIREWLVSYEFQQQLQKEIKQKEAEKKAHEILKKEAERLRIYKKYLLKSQGGSNVLRDFHTNRF